jgi:hypothetical protein
VQIAAAPTGISKAIAASTLFFNESSMAKRSVFDTSRLI